MNDMSFANLVRDLEVDNAAFREDWDTLTPADRTYVVVFTARSGSTWLTSVLSATKQLGYPEEYINPDFVRAVAQAQNTRDPECLLQMLKRRRRTRNGVFGIEVRAVDVALLSEGTFFRVFDDKTVFFNLWRDNIVAQGISLFRAVATGHYHSTEGQVRSPPSYDGEAIRHWLRHIAITENDNLRMLRRAKRPTRGLRYEDIVRDREGTIEAFARALDVSIEPHELGGPVAGETRKIGDDWNIDAEQRFRREQAGYVAEIEGARLVKAKASDIYRSVENGGRQSYVTKHCAGANGELSASKLPLGNRAMDPQQVFRCKLTDLGDIKGDFQGILAPESEAESIPKGVTVQFTANAELYHQRYFSTDQTDWLLRNTFARIRALEERPLILDIGSGSGSTVVSLLKMFGDSHIIASDVSAELLSLLRAALRRAGAEQNVTTVRLDLNKNWFHDELFDFAVGKAILHHLFDPALLIEQVFKAVKPGGSLVFYEPFDAMLALVLRQIVDAANRNQEMEANVLKYIERRIGVVQVMRCEEKPIDRYANIDDKWMFTRSYFDRVAKRIGADRLIIYPTSKANTPFREAITTWLRIGLGRGPDAMPQWAWDLVHRAEDELSVDCKEDILMTGCIIFTKAASGTDEPRLPQPSAPRVASS
jgi:LPS sulfotransferase NodH/SAM-dependent methyltransferase